jgi:hypothetical protein
VPILYISIKLDHIKVFNSGFRIRRRLPLLSQINQARFVPFPYWLDYTMITEEWLKQEKVYSSRANEAYVTKQNGRVKLRGMCSMLHFLSRDEENTLSLCLAKYTSACLSNMNVSVPTFSINASFMKKIEKAREVVLAYLSDFLNRRPK